MGAGSTRPESVPAAIAARAADQLRVAAANHGRAAAKLERAERERARAVLSARAAGLSTPAIGAVLGVSHVRVVQLTKWAAARGITAAAPRPPRPAPPARPALALVADTRPESVAPVVAAPPPPVTDTTPERPPAVADVALPVNDTGPGSALRSQPATSPQPATASPGNPRPESVPVCLRSGCDRPPADGSRLCIAHQWN